MIDIKTIGIILRKIKENNKEFIGIRNDLIERLKEFNVNIIGIPITNDIKIIINTIKLCQGIIIPGGDNVHINDYLIIKYLYDNNIPVLGICLGMQLMAKSFSKDNEKDIDNHYSKFNYVHYIDINKDSLLFKILKKERIMVNSRHHSFISNTKLKVNATCKGIIEGVEASNKKFFLGVEWHPESLNDTNSFILFKYFIDII